MTLIIRGIALAMLPAPLSAQWSTDHLSIGRYQLAATAESGLLFFGGGIEFSFPPTERVDIFDTATRTWSTDCLLVNRFRLSAASTGGKVVFAGGVVNSYSNPSDWVDIYDTSTGSWSWDQLPFAASLMAGASVDGLVFFAGGDTGNGALSIAQIYDVANGTWTIADLQYARWSINAAQDDQRVFFAGGTGAQPGAQEVLNIYDSVSGIWSTRTMPHAHASASAVVVNGKLLVAGGGPWWRIVDVYDIATGAWETEYLPNERALLVGAAVGPYAIFAGGFNYQSQLLATADVYNSITGEWSTVDLSTAVFHRTAVALEEHNIAMFAGGTTSPSQLTPTDLIDVFRYIDPLGTNYCGPANPNSTGQSAEISAIGADIAADNFVTLTASKMPSDQAGLILVSETQVFLPFAGGSQGNLCVGGNFARLKDQVQTSDSDGSFSISLDLASVPVNPPQPILAGETWHFQAWFRDLNPWPTSNFTDAVSVAFL